MTDSRRGILTIVVLVLLSLTAITPARNLSITPDGSTTLQQAVSQLTAGDTLFLRGGTYHQTAIASGIMGAAGSPVVITSYPGETATMDGTMAITGKWTLHEGDIYKTTLSQDIWELFYDRTWMTMARWPNATTLDGRIWDTLYWATGEPKKSRNGLEIDDPTKKSDLAGSGLDATGAVAVLNIGSFVTFARMVTSHSAGAGRFGYDTIPSTQYRDKWHKYYLECKLDFLDTKSEWYYDSATKVLYFYAPDGGVPAKEVRGKTQTYAFDFTESEYVILENLDFFGTTFSFRNSRHITVQNCDLLYPSYSKRMLKECGPVQASTIAAEKPGDVAENTVRNCTFQYTDGHGLFMEGSNNLLDNNLFRHIDFSCAETPGMQFSIYLTGFSGKNCTARRNTVDLTGASSTICPGYEATIELNRISNTTRLQTDGSMIHFMKSHQPGAVARYNWVWGSNNVGFRFDGTNARATAPGEFRDGTIHHNVALKMGSGYMVKGDYHKAYNNVGFDSRERNDMMVLSGTQFGPNTHSITRNNACETISGQRKGNAAIPGNEDHNWNGYNTKKNMRTQLRDVDHWDFRPKAGSDLVDKGMVIEGITGGFFGAAPDIGAYEYGDSLYWIPGYQTAKASFPIPPNEAVAVKANADLMWLQGYEATEHDVYFGTDRETVRTATHDSPEYLGEFVRNVVNPGTLTGGNTYYWRADAKGPDGTRKGDVWVFTLDAKLPAETVSRQAGPSRLLSVATGGRHGLIVKAYQGAGEPMTVTIFSLNGRIVASRILSGTVSGGVRTQRFRVTPGVYVVSVRTSGQALTRRAVARYR